MVLTVVSGDVGWCRMAGFKLPRSGRDDSSRIKRAVLLSFLFVLPMLKVTFGGTTTTSPRNPAPPRVSRPLGDFAGVLSGGTGITGSVAHASGSSGRARLCTRAGAELALETGLHAKF